MEFFSAHPIGLLIAALIALCTWAFATTRNYKPSRSALHYQLSTELFMLDLGILSVDATIGRYQAKPDFEPAAAEQARDSWRNARRIFDEVTNEFTIDSDDVSVTRMLSRIEEGRAFLRASRVALPDCCESDEQALSGHQLIDDVSDQVVRNHH